jgi:hypothetical protein
MTAASSKKSRNFLHLRHKRPHTYDDYDIDHGYVTIGYVDNDNKKTSTTTQEL